jgi:hypothetical protein
MTSLSADQKALKARYEKATETQRTIAQFFAIHYEPTNRANACRVWNLAIQTCFSAAKSWSADATVAM